MLIQYSVPLSEHCTIGLGGVASEFCSCDTDEDILQAIDYARSKGLRVHILGGGSNTVFADEGFKGVVLKVNTRGIRLAEDGGRTILSAAAGEQWDELVTFCIDHDLAGVECLSGIPGLVGATPIQNIGAYGQEVSQTILSLRVFDRESFAEKEFAGRECEFHYRQSRFKSRDAHRYVITEVTFALQRGGRPDIRYPELQNHLDAAVDLNALASGRPVLQAVRSSVLALRRRKSMVIDPGDPNTKSVGSFFINPTLAPADLERMEQRWRLSGNSDAIPVFSTERGLKVPAAWLLEKAGFHRGYRRGGVGLSANHALALINCGGGTTKELLGLAENIRRDVLELFGIPLEPEPVVVPP
jgi:UDP-N-acetylmuramate dehydrogenase